VEELVSPVLDAYRAVCRRKGLELRVDSLSSLPRVLVDAGQIEQALGNLLNNAVKFTPEGGTVCVSASANGEFVDVSVEDTGIGIAEHELSQVFDRFFRSSESIKMAVPGTGLGLAIVKAAVEAQGGRIAVESTAGKGTIFTLSLPVERT
jgi:signal transduction histidine kinase